MSFAGDMSSVVVIVCMTLDDLLCVVMGDDSYESGTDHVLFAF